MVGLHSLSWGFRTQETGQCFHCKALLRLQVIEACQDRTAGSGVRCCNGTANETLPYHDSAFSNHLLPPDYYTGVVPCQHRDQRHIFQLQPIKAINAVALTNSAGIKRAGQPRITAHAAATNLA